MKKADLIIKNAAVYSVKMDDDEIRGEAMAVAGDKILCVGTETEVMAFADTETEIVDAEGGSVLPGFGDGHTHEESTHIRMIPTINDIMPGPDDTPETIIEKYKERLGQYVNSNPNKDFIIATGWEQGYFNGGLKGIVRILSRKDLDEICPDIPMIVVSYCGHAFWVNTKALERAGWARNDFPDVPGGIIYREPDGHPTGHCTEPAVFDVFNRAGGFETGIDVYIEAHKMYQKELGNNKGLTMTCDMKSSQIGRESIKSLAEDGDATMRFSYTYVINPGSEEEDYRYALDHAASDRVEDLVFTDTLKFFIEGMIVFEKPYSDQWCDDNGYPHGFKGELIWDTDKMQHYVNDGVAHGFNIHIHALGSGAVLEAAKICAKAKAEHPEKNVTYTIAHHMCISDEALKIMADNGIIANLQPFWMYYGNDVENNYPFMREEPEYGWFPNKVYEDAGVTVAYGSDFPVTFPADPLIGIGLATTRTINPGHKEYEMYKGTVYNSEQCVSLKQAIKAATAGIAYQFGWLDFTGTLEKGKSADFVILDRNIEETRPEDIVGIGIEKTYFKGKKVYDKGQN